MRNYIDPEMNIAMFESENVVVTDSTLTQANKFFASENAGNDGNTSGLTAASVAASNILDFTK